MKHDHMLHWLRYCALFLLISNCAEDDSKFSARTSQIHSNNIVAEDRDNLSEQEDKKQDAPPKSVPPDVRSLDSPVAETVVGEPTPTVNQNSDVSGSNVTNCENEALNNPVSANGSGTLERPFLICSLDQLNEMRGNPSAHYRLGVDIDASATRTWDGGKGWNPIAQFTGIFDGNGKTISHIFMNRPDTPLAQGAGLFASLGSANFADAKIYDMTLADLDITGGGSLGGIAGWNYASIFSVSVSGKIVAAGNNMVVGGIVGRMENSGASVKKSQSSVQISNTGETEVCGGVVGRIGIGAGIDKVENNGSVSCDWIVGGIAGGSYGTIRASHNKGSVTAYYYSGGIAGYGSGTTIVSSSNSGAINSEISAGGIIANANGSGNSIDSCSNSGAIKSLTAGGITANDTETTTVSRSFNAGSIIGSNVAGGVNGFNNGTIRSSYNKGTVVSEFIAGGVSGYCANKGSIADSYNSAEVTGSFYSGGIVGNTNDCQEISHVFSSGNAQGATASGGAIGYWDGKGTVIDLHVAGTAPCAGNGSSATNLCQTHASQTYFTLDTNQPLASWTDFTATWKISNAGQLPILLWEME